MKPFNNWNDVKATTERQKLPMGGYICKIMEAKIQKTRTGSEMLVISLDIADGDYKDYYANDYRSQNKEDKKWRGVVRYFLPVEDGSEKDAYTKSNFKAFTNAVEDSNLNYHWDWDEEGLKGKFIGMITRNEEWEWNGKTGFSVRPFKLIAAEKIKSGDFTLPNDKYLDGTAPAAQNNNGFTDISEADDLPF